MGVEEGRERADGISFGCSASEERMTDDKPARLTTSPYYRGYTRDEAKFRG